MLEKVLLLLFLAVAIHADILDDAKNGRLSALRKKINAGADIEKKSRFGSTPLMISSANGHLNIVNYLIKKGANILAQNNKGRTANYYATGLVNTHINKIKILEALTAAKKKKKEKEKKKKKKEEKKKTAPLPSPVPNNKNEPTNDKNEPANAKKDDSWLQWFYYTMGPTKTKQKKTPPPSSPVPNAKNEPTNDKNEPANDKNEPANDKKDDGIKYNWLQSIAGPLTVVLIIVVIIYVSIPLCKNEGRNTLSPSKTKVWMVTVPLSLVLVSTALMYFGDANQNGVVEMNDMFAFADENKDGTLNTDEIVNASSWFSGGVGLFVLAQLLLFIVYANFVAMKNKSLEEKNQLLENGMHENRLYTEELNIVKKNLEESEQEIKKKRQMMEQEDAAKLKDLENKRNGYEQEFNEKIQHADQELQRALAAVKEEAVEKQHEIDQEIEQKREAFAASLQNMEHLKKDELAQMTAAVEREAVEKRQRIDEEIEQKRIAIQEEADAKKEELTRMLASKSEDLNMLTHAVQQHEARMIAIGALSCAFCHEKVATSINIPCNHQILCDTCAVDFRERNGEICPVEECGKSSTLNMAQTTYVKCTSCLNHWSSVYEFKVSADCDHLICEFLYCTLSLFFLFNQFYNFSTFLTSFFFFHSLSLLSQVSLALLRMYVDLFLFKIVLSTEAFHVLGSMIQKLMSLPLNQVEQSLNCLVPLHQKIMNIHKFKLVRL